MKKIYYLCRFTQQSPLRISNGDNDNTDSDLMRDGRGLPYIPGSSLAGVLRSMLSAEEGNHLFGYLSTGTSDIQESHLIVSDATLRDRKCVFETVRDGVAITNEGTAKPTGKYDFEVVECSQPYHAVLQVNDEDELVQKLIATIQQEGGISFGGRTSRGFGRMSADFRRKEFDLSNASAMTAWLNYDPFAEGAFDAADKIMIEAVASQDRKLHISADLELTGSFIIRVYREHEELNAETIKNRAGNAVIPGTTWAGIFRHHMLGLAGQLGMDTTPVDAFFGSAGLENGEDKKRSDILFAETTLQGAKPFRYRRNALDRFTMAPRNGALYTEELCYGGKGTLDILIPSDTDQNLQQLLAIALLDLHNGVLHFGGQGGIGHGLVRINHLRVDDRDVTSGLTAGNITLSAKEMKQNA